MESIEVYGKTVEDAVKAGLEQLGITEECADIEVLEHPTTKGILFKKVTQAKVRITKKASDSKRAVDFLEGIFKYINVTATTDVTRDDDDRICINLISPNPTSLIGFRGEILDSLQTLAGAVANIGRDNYKRVVVDCEDYRDKREKTLTEVAEKLAFKAVKTGRKVNLEPMNPFERRIIHTALAKNTEVKTESDGKEPNRYIVIVPNEIRDERPIIADRSRQGKKSFDKGGKAHGGKDFKGNGRYNKKGSYQKRERSPESAIYGKPKDKHNVTSFGTFIGNSQKND